MSTLAWGFLLVNLIGMFDWLVFPAAPPWYVAQYGAGPAQLDATPSAAGAARFDELLGVHYFADFYARSGNVFGAMPSLHVAYPTLVFLVLRERVRLGAIMALSFAIFVAFSAMAVFRRRLLRLPRRAHRTHLRSLERARRRTRLGGRSLRRGRADRRPRLGLPRQLRRCARPARAHRVVPRPVRSRARRCRWRSVSQRRPDAATRAHRAARHQPSRSRPPSRCWCRRPPTGRGTRSPSQASRCSRSARNTPTSSAFASYSARCVIGAAILVGARAVLTG